MKKAENGILARLATRLSAQWQKLSTRPSPPRRTEEATNLSPNGQLPPEVAEQIFWNDPNLNFQLSGNSIHIERHGFDLRVTINDKVKIFVDPLTALEMFKTRDFLNRSRHIRDVLVDDEQVDERTAFKSLLAVSDRNNATRGEYRRFRRDLLWARLPKLLAYHEFKRRISTRASITLMRKRDGAFDTLALQTDTGVFLTFEVSAASFYAHAVDFFCANRKQVGKHLKLMMDASSVEAKVVENGETRRIDMTPTNKAIMAECIAYHEDPKLVMLIGHYNKPN